MLQLLYKRTQLSHLRTVEDTQAKSRAYSLWRQFRQQRFYHRKAVLTEEVIALAFVKDTWQKVADPPKATDDLLLKKENGWQVAMAATGI